MIALYAARYWKLIGVGLIVALAIAWVARLENRRAHWQEIAERWAAEAQTVVVALRQASDNPKVDWKTAPGQIVAMGEGRRLLLNEVEARNQTIDEQARETIRLRKRGEELRRIADKAEAQRAAALRKLSNMAITPGSRNDCLQLLREAEQALDLVRSAG